MERIDTQGMARLEIGTEFAGYRIEQLIGRGGMALVYRATQLDHTGKTVALKVIAPEYSEEPEFRERFIREARLAASIEHPNVIPINEAREHDGLLFLSMMYVEGTDLHELLARGGALPPERVARLLAPVAEALDEAHIRGLVHRDVKPGNILIREHPRERVYLADFGIARSAEYSGLTGSTKVVGTLDYMAPEQLEGKLDSRSDIYALGCVVYEALTGRVPFPRDTPAAQIWAHLQAEPTPLRDVVKGIPPQFEEILKRSMAKDPADRYRTAGEMGAALEEAGRAVVPPSQETVVDEERRATPPPPPPPPKPRPEPSPGPGGGGRRRALVAGGVGLVVVLGAVAAIAASGGDSGGSVGATSVTGSGITTTYGGTTTTTTTPPPPPVTTSAGVTKTEAQEALDAYVEAFNAKDANALGKVIDLDARRIDSSKTYTGYGEVMNEYGKIFKNFTGSPELGLQEETFTADSTGWSVSAQYTIGTGGSTLPIKFHVVKAPSRAELDLIDVS